MPFAQCIGEVQTAKEKTEVVDRLPLRLPMGMQRRTQAETARLARSRGLAPPISFQGSHFLQ